MPASSPPNALLEAIAAYRAKRYDEAETRVDAAIRTAPRDPAVLQLKALLAHLRGDHRSAQTAVKQSLALRAEHAPTLAVARSIAKGLVATAEAARAAGQAASAAADLRLALELDPTSAPAWFALGLALQNCRQHAASAEAFSRVIALEPNDARAMVNRGISLQQAGDLDGAWTCYRSAYRTDPSTFAVISQALPAGDIGVLILDLQVLRERLAG